MDPETEKRIVRMERVAMDVRAGMQPGIVLDTFNKYVEGQKKIALLEGMGDQRTIDQEAEYRKLSMANAMLRRSIEENGTHGKPKKITSVRTKYDAQWFNPNVADVHYQPNGDWYATPVVEHGRLHGPRHHFNGYHYNQQTAPTNIGWKTLEAVKRFDAEINPGMFGSIKQGIYDKRDGFKPEGVGGLVIAGIGGMWLANQLGLGGEGSGLFSTLGKYALIAGAGIGGLMAAKPAAGMMNAWFKGNAPSPITTVSREPEKANGTDVAVNAAAENPALPKAREASKEAIGAFEITSIQTGATVSPTAGATGAKLPGLQTNIG